MEKKAIIIGAGPAGLTAAYELLTRTDIKPIILEKSGDIGGISKTVNYKGNRIDIGGHRFFSKSDRVMNWWLNIMPIQADGQSTFNISYQNKSREIDTASLNTTDNAGKDPDKVMLVRRRLSRIYFLRKFFTYPIQLSLDTLTKLGLWTTIAIMFSYLKAQLLPRKPEKNLEDFMINRFGQVLYRLFFKDYTEKVWGIPCDKISAEWGAQRIKGVSISKAIQHAIQSATKKKQKASGNDIAQKDTETSLIEQFLYPKFGPGQLWEEVARQVESMGGKILMHHDVKRIYTSESNNQVTAVAAINNITGETSYLEGDYFFSTMPVQELIGGLDGPIPEDVKEVAAGLQYRDFITVGILLKKLSFQDKKSGEWKPLDLKDTWIYIQEKDVKVGRLQLFNNWSPYMVKDPDNAWVGMEFFCNKTDDFWNRSDDSIKDLAIQELEKIGLASQANVLDAAVLRMEKTYPAYFGTYERFDVVRNYVDRFENLFLVGRNGMHKYNNSDHSMLTAMVAVDNIVDGIREKANIWEINTEQEYHEQKRQSTKENLRIIAQHTNTNQLLQSKRSARLLSGDVKDKYIIATLSLLSIIQLTIFKVLFPFPNFMPDSYSYIEAANNNSSINMWPVGYSKFLRIINTVVESDLAVVCLQYLFLIACLTILTYSLVNFLKMSKSVIYGMLFFIVINPVLLLISNYISSDSLFIAISVLWLTQLLYIIFQSNSKQLWLHGIVLLILVSLRYNAVYYPIISAFVIIVCKRSLIKKALHLTTCLVPITLFVWHTEHSYKDLTGIRQFSPFGGWQLASNALYMYSRVNSDHYAIPNDFAALHKVVRNHIDMLSQMKKRPDSTLGIYYLWRGPLKKYAVNIPNPENNYFKVWATVGPLYARYGLFLIKSHPIEFVKYFVVPNIVNYYVPQTEFLNVYNLKRDTVGQTIKAWFGYRTKTVKSYKKEMSFMNSVTKLKSVIEIFFLITLIGFVIFGGFRNSSRQERIAYITIAVLWLLNFTFSVAASPIVLRYQLFIWLIEIPFLIHFVHFLFLKFQQIVKENYENDKQSI